MFTLCTQALLGVAYATTASQPGLGGSLTQEGFSEAKNIATPFIFKNLKNFDLPEVDFDGGSLKNGVVQIPEPAIKDISLNILHATNGVELVANNVQTLLDADFSYKYWITVTGKVHVHIKKLNIDFGLGLGTQAGTPADEKAPHLSVDKLNVAINPDDIDVTLSGSLVAKIASVFIPLFKSTIIPAIVTNLETSIKSTITTTLNQDLKMYGNQITIPYFAGVTADYAQMGAGPSVTADNVFTMGLNGTFFDQEDIEATKFTKAVFPLRDPKSKELQLYCTDFVLNTAFESGFRTGNTLDLTYLLSEYLNITVTTDNLAVLIPEVLTKYGSGKAVGLSGKFTQKATETHVTPTGTTLDGNLMVTVTIDKETAIVAEFTDIAFALALNSKDGKVYGDISKSSLGAISATTFQTTLGLTSDAIMADLQGQVTKYITIANTNLTAGIVIPSILGIDVSNVEINNFAGYLQFGISVSSTFFEQVRDKFMPTLSAEMHLPKTVMPEPEGFTFHLRDFKDSLKFLQG